MILIDSYLANQLTLPKWLTFFGFAKTKFVYLEIGITSSIDTQEMMMGSLVNVRRITDSNKIASLARKELLQFIPD